MNKLCGLMLGAAVLAAAGCGTTEKSYQADHPPPLAKADPRTTELDPVHLPGGPARVTKDAITRDNVDEEILKLEADIEKDARSFTKAGK
jgi:hypothetical protein